MLKFHTKAFGLANANSENRAKKRYVCLHKQYYLALKSHKERKTWICNVCVLKRERALVWLALVDDEKQKKKKKEQAKEM